MKDPRKSFGVALLAVTLAFSFAACGNPAAGSTDPIDLSGYIVISPQSNIKTGDMLTAAYVGTETVQLQYQWSMNGGPIQGATAQIFFPEIVGYYTVTVSASGYNSMKSDPITVPQQGSSQSFGGVLSVTPAGTATVGTTLTAMYTGSESGRTFQWYKDSAPLTGNTSASYTPAVAGNYFVVMSATGYISKVSNGVTVTVASNPGGGGGNNSQFLGTWTGNITVTNPIGMTIPYTLVITQTGFTSQMQVSGATQGSGTYTVSGNNITFYIDGEVVGNGALTNGTLTFTDPTSGISGVLTKSGGTNDPGSGGNPSLDQKLVGKWYSTATEAAKPNGNAAFEISSSGEFIGADTSAGTTINVTTSGGKIIMKITTSGMTIDAGTADYAISGGTQLQLSNMSAGALPPLSTLMALYKGPYYKGTTGSGGTDNPGDSDNPGVIPGGDDIAKTLVITMSESIYMQGRGGFFIMVVSEGTPMDEMVGGDFTPLASAESGSYSNGRLTVPLYSLTGTYWSGTGTFDIYAMLLSENQREINIYRRASVRITSAITNIEVSAGNLVYIESDDPRQFLGTWTGDVYITNPIDMTAPCTLEITATGLFTSQLEIPGAYLEKGTYTVSDNHITFYVDGMYNANGILRDGTLEFTDIKGTKGLLTRGGVNYPGNGYNKPEATAMF